MENGTCPICFDDKQLIAIPPCHHSFCKDCIVRFLPNLKFKNGTCPLCRDVITFNANIESGKDRCEATSTVGFNPNKYWNNIPNDINLQPENVYKYIKKSLPSLPQFIHRYNQKLTNHLLLQVEWKQLDPFLKRTTRVSAPRNEKTVHMSFWFGPGIVDDIPFNYNNNRVEIATYENDGDNYTNIFTKQVDNAIDTIMKQLLTPSSDGVHLSDNIILRPIHPGMTISLFDGKGFMHTEVLRIHVE